MFYASDHGYQLGQHRLPGDKRHLYEHDVRVPLFVRGPGVAAGSAIDAPVMSVDIAPTLTHIATGSVPDDMDGRSLVPLLLGAAKGWRTDFLVSYYGQGAEPCGLEHCPAPHGASWHINDAYNNTYHCIRTLAGLPPGKDEDTMYCRFDDDENFVELYDHTVDSWQLDNCAARAPPERIAQYEQRLKQLRACAGVDCRN